MPLNLDLGALLMLALAGGVAGAIAWSIRALPQTVLMSIRRLATSTLEVRQPELVLLLDRIIFERSGKRRQQIDRMTPRGQRAPGSGWHLFRHGGRWIAAHRDLDDGGGKGDSLSELMKLPRINLWCFGGFAPLDRLIEEAELLEKEDQAAKDRSSYYTRSWSWDRNEAHQTGGMRHVVLREGMAEEIIGAGEQFFGSEEWYTKTGANWSQGWLFLGKPGTGKSRTAWGIAQHLGAKLYVLDLGRPGTTNSDVERLIRQMDRRSVLLLDDLDKTLSMIREQGQKEGASQVTLAGVLAALELPAAAGRLVIITANDEKLLDPDGSGALTRPGRIDKTWRFEAADEYQAERLLALFDGKLRTQEKRAWIAAQVGRSSAAIYSELLDRFHPLRSADSEHSEPAAQLPSKIHVGIYRYAVCPRICRG